MVTASASRTWTAASIYCPANSGGSTSNHQAGGQVGLGQSPNGGKDNEDNKTEYEDKMEEDDEEGKEEEDKMEEDTEEERIVEDEEERPGSQNQANPNNEEDTRDEGMHDDDANTGGTSGGQGEMDVDEQETDDALLDRYY